MNYSDYFANKVAASLKGTLAVTVTSFSKGVDTIVEMYDINASLIVLTLATYDAYKVELHPASLNIYTNG